MWLRGIIAITFVYLKEKKATYRMIPVGSPMLAFKESPADHETQTCYLGGMLNYVLFCHFFMGCILWLYQTQELFIICTLNIDMTENSYGKSSRTAGQKRKKNTFVKVHRQAFF